MLSELFSNNILGVAILGWAIAQFMKVLIELIKAGKFDVSLFTSTGGMPSSHSSFVSALTTAVGISEGFDSVSFAICTVFSLVVMYDAAGIRRAAGRQAQVINKFVVYFQKDGFKLDKELKNLKELLGHKPIEVAAGALVGIIVAVLTV